MLVSLLMNIRQLFNLSGLNLIKPKSIKIIFFLLRFLWVTSRIWICYTATLLHHSPLPSLDAAIQEILFEQNVLASFPPTQLDVVLASTCPSNGVTITFCKNCKLSSYKFIDCPKIECRYYHKRGHILDNCPTRPPQPSGYPTKARTFNKLGTSSVVVLLLS